MITQFIFECKRMTSMDIAAALMQLGYEIDIEGSADDYRHDFNRLGVSERDRIIEHVYSQSEDYLCAYRLTSIKPVGYDVFKLIWEY